MKKLDEKLLKNKPGVWASRVHLIVYFVALFAVVLFVFCYFSFSDARQYGQIAAWNTFIGLIAFVGLVFWLIFLLRFNVFKRFGNWTAIDGLRDFLLYFICIGALVAVCFVPSATETLTANQQFGNDEVVQDINEMNLTVSKLEYNILPKAWTADTCHVVDTLPVTWISYEDEPAVRTDSDFVSNIHTIDTADLRNKLITADSVQKINDTAYVFFECPQYRFIYTYNADEYSTVKMLTSVEIYYQVVKDYQKPDRQALLKRMEELRTKYAINSRYSYDNYYNENDYYLDIISKKYDLSRIDNGLGNVVRKKYAWVSDWSKYLRVFYYTTLLLTLLVFIFRHSTAKTFFLSVLTGVLLAILSGLMMIFNIEDEAIFLLSLMLVYYAVFAIVALSVYRTQVRTAVQGIALNLFVFLTPVIPLIMVGLHYSWYEHEHYRLNGTAYQEPYNFALYSVMAEIAGAFILLILIQFVFKSLYRKWHAAPEE